MSMRWIAWLLLVATAAWTGGIGADEGDTQSELLIEHFDSLHVVHHVDGEGRWQMSRVYFIRDGEIQAERASHRQMQLAATSNGQFVLSWDDYGVCERVITADRLVEVATHGAAELNNPPGWWAQGKKLPDLKAPNNARKLR